MAWKTQGSLKSASALACTLSRCGYCWSHASLDPNNYSSIYPLLQETHCINYPCYFHIGNRILSKNTMFPGLNVQLSDRNTELNDTNIMTWEHRSIKDYCEARKHDVTPPGIRSMTAWTYRPPAFYLEDQQQDSVDFM